MKSKLFFALLLMLLLFTACVNNSSISSQATETKTDIAAQGNKNNSAVGTSNAAVKTTPANNSASSPGKTQKTIQSFSTDEVMNALPNLLGNYFFLIESYEPPHLIGDFNGDGYSDAAIVVGARNRNGEAGEIINPAENLCYLTVDVSFQNILTGGFVPARPKQKDSERARRKANIRRFDKILFSTTEFQNTPNGKLHCKRL